MIKLNITKLIEITRGKITPVAALMWADKLNEYWKKSGEREEWVEREDAPAEHWLCYDDQYKDEIIFWLREILIDTIELGLLKERKEHIDQLIGELVKEDDNEG